MNIYTSRIFQNLLKPVLQNSNFIKCQNILPGICKQNFSKFFQDRDKAEMKVYDDELNMHPFYKVVRDHWQKPLEKKRIRKQRVLELRSANQKPQEDVEKFVVHNPIVGIEYPVQDTEIFAVVEINGNQHKIMKNDIVVTEWLDQYDINDHIVFDKVALVGTKHYTSIGRPIIKTAKVFATVEAHEITEKIHIVKYSRRRHHKRNWSSKQHITCLRIDKIEHIVGEEQLKKAVSLI